MQRVTVVLGHLAARPAGGPALRAAPCAGVAAAPGRDGEQGDDVVVVHGLRTPIAKAKRGGFKDTTPDELLSAVMTAVLTDVNLSPEKVGDICVGNVLQPGAGAFTARVAQFLSGIPETVPLSCVNRQCSSGLQAVINIAGGIRNGSYDIGLACGVETMSLRNVGSPGDVSSRMMDNSKARDCLIPMGMTSENVAERFGISRKKQDDFAMASQQKAARAQQMGLFKNEIIPVRTTVKDDQGNQKTITVLQDEGIRPSTTLEGLAKLKPAFKENGSTTAGLTVNDIDVYEISEAFASQVVYCVEKLGIPKEKVNPLGGAIALGHPLGCTGARQVVTLLNELKRRGKRAYGVVSMCIGTGMGAAAVFEYPGK
ncbi:3-ketoacyl-CoA thiolase, peroxisomal isoform X2 [Mauremys reevesii]|uniref:3-ketoacyl-CoA thiolase, peroxisomal isoform X2 n=1 Tax=Mauremys reevesii TaxID=260615 RepID=UPI00193F235A|nr:3-ketoacyl-CoA thiolase, peroxisomal isoform X2 [Mauremys reevesii]